MSKSAHSRYLRYVLLHKWFVFLAGLRYGVPLWQALIHDWHKFLPSEWFPYVNQFYRKPTSTSREGYYHNPDQAKAEFNTAWLKHINRGAHHWQHWVLPLGERPQVQRHWVEEAHSDLHDSMIAEYDNDKWQGRIDTNCNITDMEGLRRLWRLLEDANRPDPLVLPMPERYVREMVADWSGAGRAQGHGSDPRPWYRKNRDKMVLHPATRRRIEALLGIVDVSSDRRRR